MDATRDSTIPTVDLDMVMDSAVLEAPSTSSTAAGSIIAELDVVALKALTTDPAANPAADPDPDPAIDPTLVSFAGVTSSRRPRPRPLRSNTLPVPSGVP